MATTEKSIADLLTQAEKGTLVLPEFQREYVWKLQDIRSFLASLCLDYPVGSFLTVEDSADLFAYRSLEGMDVTATPSAQGTLIYLLDGQQRLTSCYLVFSDSYRNSKIDTSVRRRWFLKLNSLGLRDLTPLRDEDLMEAFEDDGGALHAQKVDLRATTRPEYQSEDHPEFKKWCLDEGFYPLSFNVLKGELNHTLLTRIAERRVMELATERDLPSDSPAYADLEAKKDKWVNWITQILNSLTKRTIPVLQIEQGATLEKVARIFETVNKTGVTLSLFELLVARATSPTSPSLRKVIEETRKVFSEDALDSPLGTEAPNWDPDQALETANVIKLFDAEFPKLVATLVQLDQGVTSLDLSKRTILRTQREAINDKASKAAVQLYRAFAFLQLRCGVPWQLANCPYQAMILPIAVALDDSVWNSPELIGKLEAWYWAAIFSGRYMEAQDRKGRNDVLAVKAYIMQNGVKPDIVTRLSSDFLGENVFREASNSTDGIYRATLQYVLSRRPYDLASDMHTLKPEVPFTQNKNRTRKLEDHHIIPKSWLAKNRKSLSSFSFVDSCLNRVWVSFEANRGRSTGAFDQNPAQYMLHLPDTVLDSLLIPRNLKSEHSDPLEILLTERYKLLRDSVVHRVTTLA